MDLFIEPANEQECRKQNRRASEEHENEIGKDKKGKKSKNLGEKVFVTLGSNAFHLASIVLGTDSKVDEKTGEKLVMIQWDSTRRDAYVPSTSIQRFTENSGSERRKSSRAIPPAKEVESNKKALPSTKGRANSASKQSKRNSRSSVETAITPTNCALVSNHTSSSNNSGREDNYYSITTTVSVTPSTRDQFIQETAKEAAKAAMALILKKSRKSNEPGRNNNQGSSKPDPTYSTIPKIVSWQANRSAPDEAKRETTGHIEHENDSLPSLISGDRRLISGQSKQSYDGNEQEVSGYYSRGSLIPVNQQFSQNMNTCKTRKRSLFLRPLEVQASHNSMPQWIHPKAISISSKDDRIYYICGFSLFFGRKRNHTNLYHYGSMVKVGDGSNEVEYDIVFMTREQIVNGFKSSAYMQVDDHEIPADPGFVYNSI